MNIQIMLRSKHAQSWLQT